MATFNDGPSPLHRRGFLGRVGVTTIGAMLPFMATRRPPEKAVREPDDPWLSSLRGKHRQIFHTFDSRDGRALMETANYLNTYPKAYGVDARDVNAIVAAHGNMMGMAIGDAIWAKYRLGEIANFKDPRTEAPATRNIYLREGEGELMGPGFSVSSLARRGVIFLVCNTSLAQASRALASRTNQQQADVHRELVDALVPGAVLVAAMIIAINRAQERGCTYLYCG